MIPEPIQRRLEQFGDKLILGITLASVAAYNLIPKLKGLLPLSAGEGWLLTLAGILAAGVINLQKHTTEKVGKEILGRIKEEADRFQNATEKASREILDRVEQEGVKVLPRGEVGSYLKKRFEEGPSEIRIVDTDPSRDDEQDKPYLAAREELLRKGKTQFRLAVLDETADLEALETLMAKHQGDPLRVSCLTKQQVGKPLFPLLIIENREVHFGDTFLGGINSTHDLGLNSRAAAGCFREYFDRLFAAGTILKSSQGIHTEKVNRIRSELVKRERPTIAINPSRETAPPRLSEVTKAARDIEIISFPKLTSDNADRQKYYDALREAIGKGVRHRRLVWNRDHLNFVENWLERNEDLRNSEHLEIRFLRHSLEKPLLVFDLLDRETVIFAQNLLGERWVQVHDEQLGAFLGDYFDSLWGRCEDTIIKSKRAKEPNFELLHSIRDQLPVEAG